jgi:hypothetical protein
MILTKCKIKTGVRMTPELLGKLHDSNQSRIYFCKDLTKCKIKIGVRMTPELLGKLHDLKSDEALL